MAQINAHRQTNQSEQLMMETSSSNNDILLQSVINNYITHRNYQVKQNFNKTFNNFYIYLFIFY